MEFDLLAIRDRQGNRVFSLMGMDVDLIDLDLEFFALKVFVIKGQSLFEFYWHRDGSWLLQLLWLPMWESN